MTIFGMATTPGHREATEKQARESSIIFERLKEEHTSQFVSLNSQKKAYSQSQTAQEKVVRELREAHSKVISQKEANFAHDLERL